MLNFFRPIHQNMKQKKKNFSWSLFKFDLIHLTDQRKKVFKKFSSTKGWGGGKKKGGDQPSNRWLSKFFLKICPGWEANQGLLSCAPPSRPFGYCASYFEKNLCPKNRNVDLNHVSVDLVLNRPFIKFSFKQWSHLLILIAKLNNGTLAFYLLLVKLMRN